MALLSVFAAAALTGMKAVVGVTTGSLGLLSEAAHSALDFGAAVMTLFAVRASARPADLDHTYGHGKVENLSALGETVLLLVTCVWIVGEAVERLFFKPTHVEPSWWAFAVMGCSIAVDLTRSRALARVARETGSQALEADALHFSTDVWSSSVVIGGLALVVVAPLVGAPWLIHADALAAVGVAGIVVWVSLQLGRRAIGELLDEVPPDLRSQLAAAVRLPGVDDVLRARVRRSGPDAFVDLTLKVGPGTTLEAGHQIASSAETAVQALLPDADVVVHIEPGDEPASADPNALPAIVQRLAAVQGLAAHSLLLRRELGEVTLELHVEVAADLTLDAAHAQASKLEATLLAVLPELTRAVTHIEPAVPIVDEPAARAREEGQVLAFLQELARRPVLEGSVHEVRLRHLGGELQLACHWAMAGATPIGEAHRVAENVEHNLRDRFPRLGRILIHVEPTGSCS